MPRARKYDISANIDYKGNQVIGFLSKEKGSFGGSVLTKNKRSKKVSLRSFRTSSMIPFKLKFRRR